MTYEQEDIKRRRAERRRKIRRKRIITGFISFLIFSLVIFSILCFTVLFPIKRVSVNGSKIYTAEQIADASEITQDNNMLLVFEDKLTEKIRSKLPFVDGIKIKRDFPDRLIITVTDAKEYATINYDNVYYTVSKKGFVLNEYAEKPENIFEIICTSKKLSLGTAAQLDNEAEAEVIQTIIKNLNIKSISIDYINVTDTLNLEAKVQGRFIVNFGTNVNLDKKIAHLKGMIDGIEEEKSGKIDLSMWSSQKTEGTFVEADIK